jgi:hypothetical protein
MRPALFVLVLALTACYNPSGEAPPLIGAARGGHADLIPALVKNGADPNQPWGVNHWPPLMHAIHKRQPQSVRALLDSGADINRRDPSGATPLMMAAGYGYDEIVNLLLDRGADARAQLADGANALALAVLGVTDIDRFTLGDCQLSTVRILLARAPGLPLGAVASAKLKGCGVVSALTGRKNP